MSAALPGSRWRRPHGVLVDTPACAGTHVEKRGAENGLTFRASGLSRLCKWSGVMV